MATPVNPSARRRPAQTAPRGRDEIVEAALDAAERLFAASGPRDVSMRDIAGEANVTYSLLNRHLGTKDELLELLLARFEDRWRARITPDTTLADAAALLFGTAPEPGVYNRLLAWGLLTDDRAAESHGRHALLHELVPLGRRPGDTDREAEARTAAILALTFGWRFFGSFIVDALRLDDPDAPARLHADIARLVERLASAHE